MRVGLFIGRHSYRARPFLDACRALGADAVVVSDHHPTLPSRGHCHLDDLVSVGPLDGVVAADDWGVLHAAVAAARLGLPGNPPDAVTAVLDKRVLRDRLSAGGRRQPMVGIGGPGPWVIKPVDRSAGEGVVLAAAADERDVWVAWVQDRFGGEALVEQFISGPEVIVEGVLDGGALHVLATFDKPGRSEGPTFPETILVSPSAHEPEAAAEAAAACRALGLRAGPVHVEVVIAADGPVVIEVHARSIGGLCSNVVRCDPALEQVLVLAALGRRPEVRRDPRPVGVLMLPVPRNGVLTGVGGTDDALAVDGITGLDITAVGRRVTPLPDRGEYLGFLYAEAATTEAVRAALHTAERCLRYRFDAA